LDVDEPSSWVGRFQKIKIELEQRVLILPSSSDRQKNVAAEQYSRADALLHRGKLALSTMTPSDARLFPSTLDPFTGIIFCIIAVILFFGIGLLLFTKEADVPLISLAGPDGIHFIFPASKKSDHSPDRAFDGSTAPDSFWEAPGPFPIELTIEFPQPIRVSGYTLKGGDLPARMPAEWSLEASEDGNNWSGVDRQKMGAWQADEVRAFRLSESRIARQLRFNFTAGFERANLRIYEIQFLMVPN
jgi:hypothetical protein